MFSLSATDLLILFTIVASPFLGQWFYRLLSVPVSKNGASGQGPHSSVAKGNETFSITIPFSFVFPLFSFQTGHEKKGKAQKLFMEMIPLVLFLISYVATPTLADYLISIALGTNLIVLSCIDIREGILPDALTLPLCISGVCINYFVYSTPLTASLLGLAAGFLFLFLIALTFEKLTGKQGLGGGDIKLFAAAGAWLGAATLPSVMFIGAATALMVLAIARPRQRLAGRSIKFGPYLSFGFMSCWLLGPILFF